MAHAATLSNSPWTSHTFTRGAWPSRAGAIIIIIVIVPGAHAIRHACAPRGGSEEVPHSDHTLTGAALAFAPPAALGFAAAFGLPAAPAAPGLGAKALLPPIFATAFFASACCFAIA